MKKLIGCMCRLFGAGVISFIILSLFLTVYYSPPIATEQPDGITNYRYIPGLKWSYMWEGFGNGKIDSMGYNNAYYSDLSNPDIVFAGSSHLEALQMPEDANFVYLLNKMFDQDENKENNFKCLNLGISGHFFESTASNYQYIVNRFKGAKYIFIEMFDPKYTPDMLDEMIEEKFHSPMEQGGFLRKTSKMIPFFRLMYKKINEIMPKDDEMEENDSVDTEPDMELYTKKMNLVLEKIMKQSVENDIVPIILMHECFWEDEEGEIITKMDKTYKKAFMECCETNGLKVIDVSSDMISEYEENFEYSYGFSNSAPGKGHLNETGHRIIAEKVYRFINEMEVQK